MTDQLQWWGYLHANGNVQVKRFFEQRDIDEARESDFVFGAHGPFYADDRDDAIHIVEKQFGLSHE